MLTPESDVHDRRPAQWNLPRLEDDLVLPQDRAPWAHGTTTRRAVRVSLDDHKLSLAVAGLADSWRCDFAQTEETAGTSNTVRTVSKPPGARPADRSIRSISAVLWNLLRIPNTANHTCSQVTAKMSARTTDPPGVSTRPISLRPACWSCQWWKERVLVTRSNSPSSNGRCSAAAWTK